MINILGPCLTKSHSTPLSTSILSVEPSALVTIPSTLSQLQTSLLTWTRVKIGFEPTQSKYYAIKIIKKSHPAFNLKNFQKEVETLSTIQHANIVNLVEFFETTTYIKKNQKSYQVAAIVMDLVENGDVFNYLAVASRFPEELARSYFRSLIESNFLFPYEV